MEFTTSLCFVHLLHLAQANFDNRKFSQNVNEVYPRLTETTVADYCFGIRR